MNLLPEDNLTCLFKTLLNCYLIIKEYLWDSHLLHKLYLTLMKTFAKGILQKLTIFSDRTIYKIRFMRIDKFSQ